MTTHAITLIPGDGTGPEISRTVQKVLEATGVKIAWDVVEAGADIVEKYGTPLPEIGPLCVPAAMQNLRGRSFPL
jgi:isocitrate dehydrogenase (NAD+)